MSLRIALLCAALWGARLPGQPGPDQGRRRDDLRDRRVPNLGRARAPRSILPFPAGFHNLRMNKDGALGLVTGAGTAKAAAAIVAAGLDPRFDLSRA